MLLLRCYWCYFFPFLWATFGETLWVGTAAPTPLLSLLLQLPFLLLLVPLVLLLLVLLLPAVLSEILQISGCTADSLRWAVLQSVSRETGAAAAAALDCLLQGTVGCYCRCCCFCCCCRPCCATDACRCFSSSPRWLPLLLWVMRCCRCYCCGWCAAGAAAVGDMLPLPQAGGASACVGDAR